MQKLIKSVTNPSYEDLLKLAMKFVPKAKKALFKKEAKKLKAKKKRREVRDILRPVRQHMKENIDPDDVFVHDENDEQYQGSPLFNALRPPSSTHATVNLTVWCEERPQRNKRFKKEYFKQFINVGQRNGDDVFFVKFKNVTFEIDIKMFKLFSKFLQYFESTQDEIDYLPEHELTSVLGFYTSDGIYFLKEYYESLNDPLEKQYISKFYFKILNFISTQPFFQFSFIGESMKPNLDSNYNISEMEFKQSIQNAFVPSKYLDISTIKGAKSLDEFSVIPKTHANNACGYDIIINSYSACLNKLHQKGRYKDVQLTIPWLYKFIKGKEYYSVADLSLTPVEMSSVFELFKTYLYIFNYGDRKIS